jgi:transcriptional regulator with XRE-family HTH domain
MSRKKNQILENTFGGKLRAYREAKGYTIGNFAKLLEISAGNLSDIENNKVKPSFIPIKSLILKTDINLAQLFSDDEGEKTKSDFSMGPTISIKNPKNSELHSTIVKILNSEDQKFVRKLEILIQDFEEFESLKGQIEGLKEDSELHKKGAAA